MVLIVIRFYYFTVFWLEVKLQFYCQVTNQQQHKCRSIILIAYNIFSIKKYMQASSEQVIAALSDKIIMNPECEENRCKICYEETKPLITLCECSGSIAYVHEDCILDWITKKMENAESVEIPICEICRVRYSAKIKVGKKKVCNKTLFKKVLQLKLVQILKSISYLILSIIALLFIAEMIFNLVSGGLMNSSVESEQKITTNMIEQLFVKLLFPACFLREALQHGRKRMKLYDESMVQIVELTLNPKLTLK